MGDMFSAEAIGSTPYLDLDDSQKRRLVLETPEFVGNVMLKALEQEPPNVSVIAAIHAITTTKLALLRGSLSRRPAQSVEGEAYLRGTLYATEQVLRNIEPPLSVPEEAP